MFDLPVHAGGSNFSLLGSKFILLPITFLETSHCKKAEQYARFVFFGSPAIFVLCLLIKDPPLSVHLL